MQQYVEYHNRVLADLGCPTRPKPDQDQTKTVALIKETHKTILCSLQTWGTILQ